MGMTRREGGEGKMCKLVKKPKHLCHWVCSIIYNVELGTVQFPLCNRLLGYR